MAFAVAVSVQIRPMIRAIRGKQLQLHASKVLRGNQLQRVAKSK
jgi:hypothetical protein